MFSSSSILLFICCLVSFLATPEATTAVFTSSSLTVAPAQPALAYPGTFTGAFGFGQAAGGTGGGSHWGSGAAAVGSGRQGQTEQPLQQQNLQQERDREEEMDEQVGSVLEGSG